MHFCCRFLGTETVISSLRQEQKVSRQKETLNIPEKSANHRNVLGDTNKKKRAREDNTLMGESSRITKKINLKKIYITLDPAESSKSGGPRPNCL